MQNLEQIKELLDEKYYQYNHRNFIEADPISIPHSFTKKEDIEIAGFLTATISWGNRKSIIANANKLVQLMDNSPLDFTLNHKPKDLKTLNSFVHRTFNAGDCAFFIHSLQNIYKKHGGLEKVFAKTLDPEEYTLKEGISNFRNIFLELKHEKRVEKHVSDPFANSSAKRLCMFLRWMVRHDKQKVDFGIWKNISSSKLCLPLDVHTGNVSRTLGLLQRKQNDWKAVEEISKVLRTMDPKDPIKYDFALFGLGVDKAI